MDSGCIHDENCKGNDVQIEWIARSGPDEPLIKYKYTGGILTNLHFYQNLKVTSGTGKSQLSATIMDGSISGTEHDEYSETFNVEIGLTYELLVEVDVSSWGSCSPVDKDIIVFESPSALSTSLINIMPVFDVDKNWYKCAGKYAITDMSLGSDSDGDDSPVPGRWKGTAGFGEIELLITSNGDGIEEIKLTFINFSCGNVSSASGSITFQSSTSWEISDRTFTVDLEISPSSNREITIEGIFNDNGDSVTGTFNANYDGTECTGAWSASPHN
jgi:hypothetical protein